MVVSGIRCGFAVVVLGLACGLAAQQPTTVPSVQVAPVGSGSVSGTVIAQDNQKPVRFAQVQLQSVASAATTQNRFGGGGGFGGGVQVRTEVDGTFLASNVVPGDYYVTATAPGYISERALLTAKVNAGADANALLASLPVVHVAADSTSSINVSIERGGTISGKIVWEDGSAASGLSVSAVLSGQASNALPAALQSLQLNGGNNFVTTDDRGVFRISGLASGNYVLRTVIQNRQQFGGGPRGLQAPTSITVYSPGVFRQGAAKAISVRAGDERDDVRVVIDLRSLRTVSGHATSSNSGQSVASGRVTLTDPSDSTLQISGYIDATGSFVVKYVPPGNYNLQISNASTQANGGRGRGNNSTTPAVTFQQFSQPVVVTDTDLSGFAATLTPSQTAPQ
jgi:hypothetical protein